MATLDPETKDREAAALKKLLDDAGLGQTQFANATSIGTPGLVWQFLNAHRPLNLSAATKFAAVLEVKIDRFSKRLAEEVRAAAPYVEGLRLDDAEPDPLAGKSVQEVLESEAGRFALQQRLTQMHEGRGVGYQVPRAKQQGEGGSKKPPKH